MLAIIHYYIGTNIVSCTTDITKIFSIDEQLFIWHRSQRKRKDGEKYQKKSKKKYYPINNKRVLFRYNGQNNITY